MPCGDPLVSLIGPLLTTAIEITAVGFAPVRLTSRSEWQYSHVTPSQLSFFCSAASLVWAISGEWQLRQVWRPPAPKSAVAISSASWKRRLSMACACEELFHASWIARWQRPQTSALLNGSSGADRAVPVISNRRIKGVTVFAPLPSRLRMASQSPSMVNRMAIRETPRPIRRESRSFMAASPLRYVSVAMARPASTGLRTSAGLNACTATRALTRFSRPSIW